MAALAFALVPVYAGTRPATHEGQGEDGIVAYPANYDVRWQLAEERAGKVGVPHEQVEAEAALSARVPGFVVHRDEVSKLPTMLVSSRPGERLSARSSRDPESAARQFIARNRNLYGLGKEELASLRQLYVSEPEGGATIVRFAQDVDGIPVFGAELAVVMDAAHRVVGTGGTVYPDAGAGLQKAGWTWSFEDAVAQAARDLSGRDFAPLDFQARQPDDRGYVWLSYLPDLQPGASRVFEIDPRARRVLFPIAAGETIPAYYVELLFEHDSVGRGAGFSLVIGADDGHVLFRKNLVSDVAFTYRMFADPTGQVRPFDSPQGIVGSPHPTGTPDSYQAPNATTVDITIDSLIGASDPWIASSGQTNAIGNNVEAYLDLSTGRVDGVTSAPQQFLYGFDHAAASTDATVRQSKVVHLFYFNNWLHDVWYLRGFNEVSFNAQTDNYGRGGLGGDSIRAEGEDRSGTNNANMFTPADGSRPRMQMFRFTAPEPDRDSSHDFGIVAHEWMHYMSNRLVGNASGLNNNQGGSMGEGWGDWNGLVVSVREGDDLDGCYSTGAWATYQLWGPGYTTNYYYGIRRYPYSTRLDRSPLTFKDIGPGLTYPSGVPRNTNVGGSASEVHNAGEIWCSMLWECAVAMFKAYGVDAGRDRIMQYVADGMKSTPVSPTYGQARDGIITAANATHPEDVPLLWQAFAKRGIGEGAVSPASGSSTHSGITESFLAPAAMPDDTVGVVSGNTFSLRHAHVGGAADQTYAFATTGFRPLVGNWNGGSGVGTESADNPGMYDMATGNFYLKNSHGAGIADLAFQFGPGGGFLPVAGDWNGDGVTTVGIYDPANGIFYLKNSNAGGAADVAFFYGPAGSTWVPVAGDWNNDGIDTIGLYDPATGIFYLRNSLTAGAADVTFQFGPGGAFKPVAGDWDSNGVDTVGIYNQSTGAFYLRNSLSNGPADRAFLFGTTGTLWPVAGNFDGQ